MERLIRVARVSEVERGKGKLIHVAGNGDIAIFNAAGAFYATQDHCSGDGRSLSESTIDGTVIECSSDKARFFLPTGECLYPPGTRSINAYRVQIDRDEIQIDLEETLQTEISTLKAVA
jgi:3-phenylpropionate/trans-cinnamate dioxygenase ferredoxin subunit